MNLPQIFRIEVQAPLSSFKSMGKGLFGPPWHHVTGLTIISLVFGHCDILIESAAFFLGA